MKKKKRRFPLYSYKAAGREIGGGGGRKKVLENENQGGIGKHRKISIDTPE